MSADSSRNRGLVTAGATIGRPAGAPGPREQRHRGDGDGAPHAHQGASTARDSPAAEGGLVQMNPLLGVPFGAGGVAEFGRFGDSAVR